MDGKKFIKAIKVANDIASSLEKKPGFRGTKITYSNYNFTVNIVFISKFKISALLSSSFIPKEKDDIKINISIEE